MVGYDMPIQLQASLALLLAQLSFSGWHILGSVSFHDGADPLVFCLYRIILGTTLMHLYVRFYGMSMAIDPADYARFLYLGILSFISMILTALCLRYIAPSRFAIFQPSIPCIVAGLSMMSGLEKLSKMKLLGLVVAVGGAFIAETWKFQANANAELDIPLGTGLAVGQVLAMGSLLVEVKPLLNKYQPAVVSCVYFTIATVATILLCLARIDVFPTGAFGFNGQTMPWIALVYAAVFTTLFAFIALSWGGKYLNPTVSTVYFTFQPLGTIVLSSAILGSVVTLPEVIGGLMIVTGLGITSTATLLYPKEEECSEGGGASSTGSAEEGVCMIRTSSTERVNALHNSASPHTPNISTLNMSTSTTTTAADHLNWPTSSLELMKAAYRNQASLLTCKHSGYTYNPVSAEEPDVESGPTSSNSPRGNTTPLSTPKTTNTGSTYHSNHNTSSNGIAFSLEPPDEYSQYEGLVERSPPPIISAHSTKLAAPSPVRQRSVTVDSPTSSTTSGTTSNTTAVLKGGAMRRNQSNLNA